MEQEPKSNQDEQNREIAKFNLVQENNTDLNEEDSLSSSEKSIQNSRRRSRKNYKHLFKKDDSFFSIFKFLGITITVSSIFAIIYGVSSKKEIKPTTEALPNSSLSVQNNPINPYTYQNPVQTPTPAVTNGAVTGICAPNSLLNTKVKDWVHPTIHTLSKNLIITAGHNGLNDIRKPGDSILTIKTDGTNGLKENIPVHYQGQDRSLEGAVNLRTVDILQNLLRQAGFNVTYVKAEPGENLRSKMERIKKMISGTDTFAFEIHYDDPVGSSQQSGSGVIPPNIDPTLTANSTYINVSTSINLTYKGISGYDIALAKEFGAYPQNWRNGLGGPRRGVTLLELDKITKVESLFRKAVKTDDYRKVDKILNEYANRVIRALASASSGETGESVPNCIREGYMVYRGKN